MARVPDDTLGQIALEVEPAMASDPSLGDRLDRFVEARTRRVATVGPKQEARLRRLFGNAPTQERSIL